MNEDPTTKPVEAGSRLGVEPDFRELARELAEALAALFYEVEGAEITYDTDQDWDDMKAAFKLTTAALQRAREAGLIE